MPWNPAVWPCRIRLGVGVFFSVGIALATAACSRDGADWRQTQPAQASTGEEAGYVRPPRLTGAARTPDGGVILTGLADAQDRVRLSAPGGGAYGGTTDTQGRWSVPVPVAGEVRLLGLSEVLAGRAVQAEGYIAVLPSPGRPGVLLRGGAGAIVMGAPSSRPRIAAIDCDADGGAVISGLAKPGESLHLSVDRGVAVETRADVDGRFSVALGAAMSRGEHQATVQSAGDVARESFVIGASPPLVGPPFRGLRLADRWRIDWLTPGGGPQTTYVFD